MLVTHTIPPVFNASSKVLVLGSIPSPASRAQGFFYGHPQNRFWQVLSAVLGEPLPQTVEQKREMLLRRGIALWDVLYSCEIEGASDATIKNPVPNDFSRIFETAKIRKVFTTGKRAYALYTELTGGEAVCLPSTSPANRAVGIPRLMEAYSMIAEALSD